MRCEGVGDIERRVFPSGWRSVVSPAQRLSAGSSLGDRKRRRWFHTRQSAIHPAISRRRDFVFEPGKVHRTVDGVAGVGVEPDARANGGIASFLFRPSRNRRGSSLTFGRRKTMSTCPHCGAPANPLRPSLYAAFSSYTCTSCKKKSRFDRRALFIICGAGVLASVLTRAFVHLEGLTLVAVTVVGTAALMAVLFFSLTLRPSKE